jgi:hypothetical protein
MNNNNFIGRRVIIVASNTFKQLVMNSSVGYTDSELVSKTSLSFGTIRKMKAGIVVGIDTIMKYCAALEIDAEPFIDSVNNMYGIDTNPAAIMTTTIKALSISPETKQKLAAAFFAILAEEQHSAKQLSKVA